MSFPPHKHKKAKKGIKRLDKAKISHLKKRAKKGIESLENFIKKLKKDIDLKK